MRGISECQTDGALDKEMRQVPKRGLSCTTKQIDRYIAVAKNPFDSYVTLKVSAS